MKPGNKWERECYALMDELSEPTIKQFEFARATFGQQAYYKKNGIMIEGTYRCCECGHEWKAQGAKTTVCPNCGCKLEVVATKKKKFTKRGYYVVIDCCHQWMVQRYFYFEHILTADGKVYADSDECMQIWKDKDGHQVVIAKDKRMYPCRHYNVFNAWSPMTVKRPHKGWNYYGTFDITDIAAYGTYVEKVPKWLSYVNWKKFKDYDVAWFMEQIHKHPMVETLLKANRPKTLVRLMQNHFFDDKQDEKFKMRLNSIRLAIKNKYRLIERNSKDKDNFKTWWEMLDQLVELGLDWHNAHYVCPKNLMEVHNKYTDRISKKKALEKAKEMEQQYKDNRQQFFGLCIKEKDIIIQPLHSVMEFYYEWQKMHHCVYSHEYFNIRRHPDSLILSARRGDNWNEPKKVLETIEIDIKKFEIMQVHGFANQDSDCHKEIVEIMKRNMAKIKKIVKDSQKSKRPKKASKLKKAA